MKSKIILIFLYLSFLLASCSKDKCGDGKNYYNLSENDKSQIPYKGNESLKFLSNSSSDTLIFQAEPEWSYYTNSKFYGADCPMEDICQGRGIAFFNISQNKKIVINQLNYTSGGKGTEINYNDLFTIDGGFEYAGKPEFDSISINGVTYYNVYMVTDKIQHPKDVGYLFNRTEGVLLIYSNTGDTLKIIK